MKRFVNKVKTWYSFSVLVVYIFTVAIPIGWLYSKMGRKDIDERRAIYHNHKCSFFGRFMRHYICSVKQHILNPYNEKFQKPAIIIANHQSLIDLPATLQLYPKLVVMTGQWVWDSKIYHSAIRFAEFFPASMPMDEVLPKLRDLMSRGFSIIIFPEGTRSEDCQVHTFRRGAFHLVEQLKCDVLPIYLHGTGRRLPKKDFCLTEGDIYVEIGERISYESGLMGQTHGELTRFWHKQFIKHMAELEAKYPSV